MAEQLGVVTEGRARPAQPEQDGGEHTERVHLCVCVCARARSPRAFEILEVGR